jgi:hypothetical protein
MSLFDEPFDVRDTARAANIIPHMFLAGLVATPLLLALYHPPFQAFIEAQPTGTLKGFIFLMATVNAAMAIDLIGLFLNLFSRKPALRLTRDGVEGLYGWLQRRFYWEDVEHVSVGLNHIQFVRRTGNPVIGLLQSFRSKGDKRRAADQIYLKLSTADRELGQILYEIEKRCPGLPVISSPYAASSRDMWRASSEA